MKVERVGDAFVATFESEEELREEHRVNLSQGALRLPTSETVPVYTSLSITLRGPAGSETQVRATVVAKLPDGLALAIEGDAGDIVQRLTAAKKTESAWDRVRALTQMEKILLAVKAERSERALLLQDNDPRVLLSLLGNPRLTIDEVTRVAKSSFLNYQVAELIQKSPQWMASLDVRLALIHNPKTPPAFAMRILPTLPETEIRAIARSGTNMQLKQAAIRRLQGK